MNSVSIQNVSLKIGKIPILMDISAEFAGPGNVVLFGPNGAGKSTLLKAISGMVEPQNGDVLINGLDMRKNREGGLENLGAHIEPGSFYPQLTGSEVLNFMEKVRGNRGNCRGLGSHELIERLGMADYADSKIRTYSTGMRRKLSVAAAVICAPPIILLDEPTDGLDPASSKSVKDLIHFLHREKDCLIISTSHDLEGAEAVSTRNLVLIGGKIVFDSHSAGKLVTIKLVVSNPKDIDQHILGNYDHEVEGQTIRVRNIEKKDISGILRDLVVKLRVESVSIQSEFQRFYESYLTNVNKLD